MPTAVAKSWWQVRLQILVALGFVVLLGCHRAPPVDIEVEVRNVGFDQSSGLPVVVLQAPGDARVLPIWIGTAEAQAIAMEMQKVASPRPMTHDLVKTILESTGVSVRRVRITNLEKQTFFASLVLDQGGREIVVDSRPSDAIAIALRFACPILVSRALLDGAGVSPRGGLHDAAARIWGMTVQDVTPALAESLGIDVAAGVLVSDPGRVAGDADGPQRGDVIVAVDGKTVESVADLQVVANEGPAVRRLAVHRGANRLVVRFDSQAVIRRDLGE